MNMQTEIGALRRAPWTQWLGTAYAIALPAAATGGRCGAFEARVVAGGGPPLHVHHGEDEIIHVIEGEVDFWLDGAVTRLGAGRSVFLPRGIPHTFRVTEAAPARTCGFVTPGGFEGFFAAAASERQGPHDPAGLAAFAERWQVAFLGPNPLMPRPLIAPTSHGEA